MTDAQQREAARQFYYKWNGKGKEDEDARSYWFDVLVNIFGIENVTDRVQFEKKVAGDKSMKRIDVYIPETHVLIEQKSLGIALDKPQPGHENKTPSALQICTAARILFRQSGPVSENAGPAGAASFSGLYG